MVKRLADMLRRVRRIATSAPQIPGLPRTWEEELAAAGTTADAWLGRSQTAGRLFISLADSQVAALGREWPREARQTVDAATRILGHEFDLLGSGRYVPTDHERPAREGYAPIDWHLDPVSGLSFPRSVPLDEWSFDRMRPGCADIKLPWELSRCQHWPLLGQAYRLNGDPRFALEIANQLRDFMEANPIGTGVNWTCTMDVALRAANWALGLELVRSCASLDVAFWGEAYRALFEHGVFIERHLENNYEVTSNHFLSNVVGLFYVAAVFSDLPSGKAWNRQCRKWLKQEMAVQVFPDGVDYESSVPYHRLVTELFLGAARVADHAGHPLPGALLRRVRSMVDFMAAVLRPDGLMPQVGDADDGRLHILSEYGTWRPEDPRHLFGPAAIMFRRDEWLSLAGPAGAWEAAWWGLEWPKTGAKRTLKRNGAHRFLDAGLTVIRQGDHYLLVTNGAVGTNGFGNHKHNDLLGFEYHYAGRAVLVDPGSYLYTSAPDDRNLFRSTRSHNTVAVDGEEQNELRPQLEWLFRMFEKAHPEQLALSQRGETIEYKGRHKGYTRLPQPILHERTFRMNRAKGSLNIVDVFEGQGQHLLQWHFRFAPGVEVVQSAKGVLDVRAPGVALRLVVPPDLESTVSASWYSPSYGRRVPCLGLDLQASPLISGRCEYRFHLTCDGHSTS